MSAKPAPTEAPFDPDALPDGFEVFADEAAFDRFCQEGDDAIDSGDVVSHEHVLAHIEKLVADARAR